MIQTFFRVQEKPHLELHIRDMEHALELAQKVADTCPYLWQLWRPGLDDDQDDGEPHYVESLLEAANYHFPNWQRLGLSFPCVCLLMFEGQLVHMTDTTIAKYRADQEEERELTAAEIEEEKGDQRFHELHEDGLL